MKDTSKHVYCEPDYFLSRGIPRQRYEAVAAQAELLRLAVRRIIFGDALRRMQQARKAVCTLASGRR